MLARRAQPACALWLLACSERVVVGYESAGSLAAGGATVSAAHATTGGRATTSGIGGGGSDLELPERSELVWQATFETGDISEWLEGDAGEIFIDNDASYRVTAAHAPSGGLVFQGTVESIAAELPQAMLLREHQAREAYYAASFCVRENYDTNFWVIMKFMGEGPFLGNADGNDRFDIDLSRSEDDGQLHLQLDEHGGDSVLSPVPVPIDGWFRIEAFYRSTPAEDGRLVVWQDGTLVFDTGERPTAPSEAVTFGVGVAAWRVRPLPASIFIDDVQIHSVE